MMNRRRNLYLLTIIGLGSLLGLAVMVGPALAQAPTGTQDCQACHRQPNPNSPEGAGAINTICLDCHSKSDVTQEVMGQTRPLTVNPAAFADSLHGTIACTACHADVAQQPHAEKVAPACDRCHTNISRHVNTGAAHLTVDCAACHNPTLAVTRNSYTRRVELATFNSDGEPLDRTGHDLQKTVSCDKCHYMGNALGASDVALPPRSLVCMACHDASPVVKDAFSGVGLLIALIGFVMLFSLWLRGSVHGHSNLRPMEKISYVVSETWKVIFSRRLWMLIKSFILDALLHRYVLQESVSRWVMHTLIYLPFLGRFLLGLITWLATVLYPATPLTHLLADKDAPAIAFTYDLLAVLMLIGVLIAVYRRFVVRDKQLISLYQDKLALLLLGGIYLLGFLTEGLRLLVNGVPFNVGIYSFLGWAVVAALYPLHLPWSSIYPYLWYIHAALAAALIAYLPFSKMLHVLVSPLIVTVNAVRKEVAG
jgi:nitrate reductase gamma subunit